MDVLKPFLEAGLTYGLGAIGLGLTYRFLRFPDFTTFGSIVVGGIVGIFFANLTNAYVGLLTAGIAGGILGWATAYLSSKLGIPLVISGIVTFVGSSTPAYLIAANGVINVSKNLSPASRLFRSTFYWPDAIILFAAILILSIATGFVMKTKLGSLIFALSGTKSFVRFRHRSQDMVRWIVLASGNAIVAVAGACFALNVGFAHVPDHADFIPFALGGIFAGAAIIAIVSKLSSGAVKKIRELVSGRKGIPGSQVSMSDAGDSSSIGLKFFTFAMGAAFFTILNGALMANAFANDAGDYSIPYAFRHVTYIIVAVAMAFAIWLSGPAEDD